MNKVHTVIDKRFLFVERSIGDFALCVNGAKGPLLLENELLSTGYHGKKILWWVSLHAGFLMLCLALTACKIRPPFFHKR